MEQKREYIHGHARPFSVKVLIGYVAFLFVFYILHFLYEVTNHPATILFGKVFTGATAVFIDGLVLTLLGFVIYGLYKRTSWSWPLAVMWFVISIANALFSLALVESGLMFIVKDLVLLSFVSVLFVDGFVLWYIIYRRQYFHHKTLSYNQLDKFFVYALATFWIIVILLSLAFGIRYYKITTQRAELLISELKGLDYDSAANLCSSKDGFDRDLCFTAMSALFPEKPKEELCANVQTEFYKITCTKMI